MKIFTILYLISVGMWIATLFIAAAYSDSTPMWIALVVMNVLNGLRIWKEA